MNETLVTEKFVEILKLNYKKFREGKLFFNSVVGESRTAKLTLNSNDFPETYFIKEKAYYLLPSEFNFHLNIQFLLATRGFPSEKIIISDKNNLYFEYEARFFRISIWEMGKPLGEYKEINGYKVGQQLAELHKLLEIYNLNNIDKFDFPKSRHRTYPINFQDWKNLIKRFLPINEDRKFFRKKTCFRNFKARTFELFKSLPFDQFKVQIIHGDAHLFNIIKGPKRLLTWIDFEDSRFDYRLVDIVWLSIISGFFKWHSLGENLTLRTIPNWEIIEKILIGYNNNNPLTLIEKKNIPKFIELYLPACFDNCFHRSYLHNSEKLFVTQITKLNCIRDKIRNLQFMINLERCGEFEVNQTLKA